MWNYREARPLQRSNGAVDTSHLTPPSICISRSREYECLVTPPSQVVWRLSGSRGHAVVLDRIALKLELARAIPEGSRGEASSLSVLGECSRDHGKSERTVTGTDRGYKC